MRGSFSEWLLVIHSKHPIARLTTSNEVNEIPIIYEPHVIASNNVVEAQLNVPNVNSSAEHHVIHNETSDYVHISYDDIQPEIDFWESSIVCAILGAIPPLNVFEGFIRRIWKKYGVDKVAGINKGVFIVRFKTMEQCDKVLVVERPFFDYKPMIMKPWNPDVHFAKDEVRTIPIWVNVHVNFKYWGFTVLEKIVQSIGSLLKTNQATTNSDRLQFARCLIVVRMMQDLPDEVCFINEKGEVVDVKVEYQWKPILCDACKKLGHEIEKCRTKREAAKDKGRVQQWKPKPKPGDATSEQQNRVQKDPEVRAGNEDPISKNANGKEGNKEGVQN